MDKDAWRALAFLARRTLANRAVRLARALRSPRYLAAFVAGLAYFGWMFGSVISGRGRAGGAGGAAGSLPVTVLLSLAPLLVGLRSALWWASGRYQEALAFSPAEADFLLPAPVTRRQLLLFKLAKLQPPLLFSVLLGTAFLAASASAFEPLRLLRMALAFWLLLTTLRLHQTGASLVRTAAASQGRAGVRHQWPALLFFGGAFAVVTFALVAVAPALMSGLPVGDTMRLVDAALASPGPRAALLPFRWILAPLLAPDAAAWWAALPGAALILALHFAWVVRTDAAFEEGAAEAGRTLAARAQADGEGSRGAAPSSRRRGRVSLPLAPTGSPAGAILWKNLTLALRQARGAMLLVVVAAFAGAYVLIRAGSGDPTRAAAAASVMAFTMAGFAIVGGSVAVRNDLRADLGKLDLLRTFPIGGRSLVRAELAASATLLTVLQFALLSVGAAFLMLALPEVRVPMDRLVGALAALFLIPPVNVLLVGAQNALALLFPAWTQIGAGRPGGVERTGMFMLTLAGTLLFMALALLPAATLALAVWLPLRGGLGEWAFTPAALGASLVLWAEVAAIVILLGDRYDALDPAEAGLLR